MSRKDEECAQEGRGVSRNLESANKRVEEGRGVGLMKSEGCGEVAVERTWHMKDSQGQILALAFR